MAEQTGLPGVDFVGIDGWTMSEGGAQSDLLTHNGVYEARFAAAEPCTAKSGAHNPQFHFQLVVEDADNRGRRLHCWTPYAGTDANGKPNKERLWSAMASAGLTDEARRALAAEGLQDPNNLGRWFLKDGGRKAYVEVEAEQYEKTGRWSSKVTFFVTKDRYETDKALGVHRKGLPNAAAAGRTASARAAAPAGNGTGQAAVAQTPSDAIKTALELV